MRLTVYKMKCPTIFLAAVMMLLTSCGFHLRGSFSIPPALQTVQIQPHQPYDPFQRQVGKILKSNGVRLSDTALPNKEITTLTILNQQFSERTVAYGSDGQPNRAVLQYIVTYQITDPTQSIAANERSVQVERELTINPEKTLGTDNERQRLKNDLYLEAAFGLTRQLSAL
jgi:LPS-assembly lipoprotein